MGKVPLLLLHGFVVKIKLDNTCHVFIITFAVHRHSIIGSHGYSLKAITKTCFIQNGSDLAKPNWFTLKFYNAYFKKKSLLKLLHKQLKTILKLEKKAKSLSSLWNQCQNKTWYNGQYLSKSIWKTVEHILEVRILIFFSSIALTI